MNRNVDVLWLSISPSLKCFDQRLLATLTQCAPIRRWDYCQTLDEPCSLEAVVAALHEYLCQATTPPRKVHLLGHGVSGVVALMYTRQHPENVASLTLLSVGALPAVNWQAHYYALRRLLPCSREMVLAQMTRLLFGQQPCRLTKAIAQLLSQDLDNHLTLHSLAHHTKISPGGVEVPLLVCSGEFDAIVSFQQQQAWYDWMKPGDRLWVCPQGHHFFQFHHFEAVADAIAQHWQTLSTGSQITFTPHPKR
ncbi:MAG: alpha/beta hydrolase [Phormidesmis sp. RL_2_1]|nr:alpha/beta hydrolase [Phormidesmis sp. RL_2_1]